jgi:hypothetical protein
MAETRGTPGVELHFNTRQSAATMNRYSVCWVSSSYIWRTHKLPDASVGRRGEHGDNDTPESGDMGERKPNNLLTASRIHALWLIEQVLMEAVFEDLADTSGDDSGDGSSDTSSEFRDSESEGNAYSGPGDEAVMDVSEEMGEQLERCVFAFLDVEKHCGWKRLLQYAKMLVLYNAMQARKQKIAELRKERMRKHGATSKPVRQSIESVMTLAGDGAPMSWILQLWADGKAIAKSVNPERCVFCKGGQFLYLRASVPMAGLRSVV